MSLDGTRRLKEVADFPRNVVWRELFLDQFRRDLFFCDQIHHAEKLCTNQRFGKQRRQFRHFVHDHHWNVEQRSFNRRRTTANDGGIGGHERTVGVTLHDGKAR